MSTVKEFNNKQELVEYLSTQPYCWQVKKESDITSEFYCYDSRIGWESYLVKSPFGVVGFSNAKI